MYVKYLEVENIKSLNKIKIDFNPPEGWHVLLGDNGSGKTTLAKAISLVLAGPDEVKALRKNWLEWIQTGKDKASVRLDIINDPKFDKVTGEGRILENYFIPAKLNFSRTEGRTGQEIVIRAVSFPKIESKRYLWGNGEGWFCASYGPYRRFSGGNKDYEKLYYSNPRLAPHLSIFGEDVALTECLEWLLQLRIKELETKKESIALKGLKIFAHMCFKVKLHYCSSKSYP